MSAATTSIGSYGNLNVGVRNGSRSFIHTPCSVSWMPTDKHSSTRKLAYSFGTSRRNRANSITNMDLNAVNNLTPVPPLPSGSPFPGWSNWMLLTIIPMVIPLFMGKWGNLLSFTKNLDSTLETIENLSEAIEDVAEGVDKIADEVSENLPQGSKLRNIIERIDRIAEETIKAADSAQEVLQKVDDVQNELEKILKQPAVKAKVADEKIPRAAAEDKEETTKKVSEEK